MSKNANYKAGYRAERKAFETLKGYGFTVFRTAGSHGLFDLIGVNEKTVIFVQVKTTPFGKIAPMERIKKEIEDFAVPEGVRKELWVMERRSGFHYFPLTSEKKRFTVKEEEGV